jgi:ferrochelatase
MGNETKAGVLLVNLGTPDAPDVPALRRYLREFLADPRVVTLPRLVWLPILHGLVLRTRPARSAAAYARIWTPQGSPLLVNSRALADGLRGALGPARPLALGMRYGNPSILTALTELKQAGITRLVVLPLYPHYAESTTGSSFAAVRAALAGLGWAPELRTIGTYHDHPAYISALAASVREHWAEHHRGEKLIVSFHGIPRKVADAGDPYPGQCAVTARLLARELALKDEEWQLSYQSRFGPAEWLQPYTLDVLKRAAAGGLRRVDVICPGFAADCLETLEEIALRYAEAFRAAGGQRLRYVPALNARPAHVEALAGLVRARS